MEFDKPAVKKAMENRLKGGTMSRRNIVKKNLALTKIKSKQISLMLKKTILKFNTEYLGGLISYVDM